MSKCDLAQPEVAFCGFMIGSTGIKCPESKINAIINTSSPSSQSEVRRFLRMASYYHIIAKYAEIAKPLTELTGDRPFKWAEVEESAFRKLSTALTTAPVLYYPDHALPFTVTTNASTHAIGAVLEQTDDKSTRPVAYFSQKLSSTEQNYPTHKQGFLAIRRTIEHWRHHLIDKSFAVRTDSRAASFAQSQRVPGRRQARWLDFLSQFDFTHRSPP